MILKQAPQTFPCGDRFIRAFEQAGLPFGVFQALSIDVDAAKSIIENPLVNYVHFTGSVEAGAKVNQIAASRFIGLGLELGGCDPAYVREDADPINAAENLIDGAMYNSGQSCCGIQRIYVHANVYDEFIDHCIKVTNTYILGSPLDEYTTIGPVVSERAADNMRNVIQDALSKNGIALIEEAHFPNSKVGSAYVAPQIIANANHEMRLMTEEVFAPIVGICKVI